MLDTTLSNQDLVNLDLDMKKAEVALCVFIERAFRAKITNGGSFIVGTNSRYFKSFIETIFTEMNIRYTSEVNTSREPFDIHIKKPEVFGEYDFADSCFLKQHITWSYYLDSCRSCNKKDFLKRLKKFYNKGKVKSVNALAPVFSLKASEEQIKTILLNKHNEYNFENSTFLLESFIRFYSVDA